MLSGLVRIVLPANLKLSTRRIPKVVAALKESLLAEGKKAAVFADAQQVLDAEVSEKKGASAIAVKAGYAAAKKAKPSLVPDAIAALLPEFLAQLEPYWQTYSANPAGSFADALAAKSDEVAEALLTVTDDRAEASEKAAVKKVYSSMRGSAKKNVIEALPRVGDLVQRHA